MAERERNGGERHGSAVNRVLNRIAEAVGLGSSESDRGDAARPEAEGDDSAFKATRGAAGEMATGTGAGARLDEDNSNNRALTGGVLDR